jgi:hypothetical protein
MSIAHRPNAAPQRRSIPASRATAIDDACLTGSFNANEGPYGGAAGGLPSGAGVADGDRDRQPLSGPAGPALRPNPDREACRHGAVLPLFKSTERDASYRALPKSQSILPMLPHSLRAQSSLRSGMARGFESRWGRHHAMPPVPPPALPPAASASPANHRLCRSTPPLPQNEAPGVVRTSGALCVQTLASNLWRGRDRCRGPVGPLQWNLLKTSSSTSTFLRVY